MEAALLVLVIFAGLYGLVDWGHILNIKYILLNLFYTARELSILCGFPKYSIVHNVHNGN